MLSEKREYKKLTLKRWANAATRVVGARPGQLSKSKTDVYLKRVWCGVIWENLPETTYPSLSMEAGLKSDHHSSCHNMIAKWKEFDWKVRHAWLMLADAAVSSRPDWTPAVWAMDLHECALMSLGETIHDRSLYSTIGRFYSPLVRRVDNG